MENKLAKFKTWKKLLNKKESTYVTSGDSFVVDYKKRLKVIELKKVVCKLQMEQSKYYDNFLENPAGFNWEPYFELDKKIEKLNTSISEIESEINRQLNFEIMIFGMVKEYNELIDELKLNEAKIEL